MQVSVETTTGLERRLTVEVPAERVESEIKNRLMSLSRTVKMPGFRPGKVPMKVLTTQYGSKVRQEVLAEVTQSSFYEAIVQEKLTPASKPRFESSPGGPGQDLAYTATFEVYPSIELAPLESLEVQKPSAEISEKDVDEMMQTMRKQRVEWQDVEREAKDEDRLMIDYRGTIDNQVFSGGEGKDTPVVLGSKTFIAGFEAQLVGLKAGDEKTISVTFPDDYHAKELAGKEAQFEVKVNNVSEALLPGIDDEFAKSFGVADGDLNKLKEEVQKSMQHEMDQAIKDNVKRQVLDGLYQANTVELPNAMLEDEINQMMDQSAANLRNQGITIDAADMDKSRFEEKAKRRASLGLIVADIIKANGLKADPVKVRAAVETIAAGYDDPEEVVKWYYGDRNRISNVESVVLEDQVVEWVLEKANVTINQTSFEEVMKERRAVQ
ncbi:MAG: trigger factor [Gammaproteobacteria bacterium]